MENKKKQIKILKHTHKKKIENKGESLRIPLFPTLKNKREKENPKNPLFFF